MSRARTISVVSLGTVEYQRALELQEKLVAARLADQIGDTLLLLEHPHIYTLGRGADDRFILNAAGVPVTRVSRGGQVTYHGPGQLVCYPILKLDGAARDVSRYLRTLEQAMIDALAKIGIDAARRDKFTGVWVGGRKIASIGVGIRRWVTYHGFALNVACDLRYFDAIVPCGIDGCEMTSIERLGSPIRVKDFSAIMRDAFVEAFGYERIVHADATALWPLVDAPVDAQEARI